MVKLERVSTETFEKVVDLRVAPQQNNFVAPNVVSLAQAWLYYDDARPYAILADDQVVGFVMLDWDEDERTVGIWRFMIAEQEQNKGYGKQAMELIIQMAKACGKIDLLHLDYVPGNTVAVKLYRSFGFVENGDIEDGEIVMTMRLTTQPEVGIVLAGSDAAADIAEFCQVKLANDMMVPQALADDVSRTQLLENESLARVTLYGDTIGVILNDEIYLNSAYADYLNEAKQKWHIKKHNCQ